MFPISIPSLSQTCFRPSFAAAYPRPPKAEINLALTDLRYTGHIDASGDDVITLTSSDGYLEGNASSTVSLAWPTGAATRPPELSFRPSLTEMPEDGSTVLGVVDVRFGDGSSVVQGTVHCSAGLFEIADDGGLDVVILEEGGQGAEDGGGDTMVLRGLPQDVATVLSMVTYRPPTDWSSRVYGVVTISVEIQATQSLEVRSRAAVVPEECQQIDEKLKLVHDVRGSTARNPPVYYIV